MAALIPHEKWFIFLKKNRSCKTQQAILRDKCCHLGLMEPHKISLQPNLVDFQKIELSQTSQKQRDPSLLAVMSRWSSRESFI